MTKLSICNCGNQTGDLELTQVNAQTNRDEGQKMGNNFLQNLKNYLLEYCREGSLHGVKYLGDSKTLIEKLLWATLIIVSVGMCGYLISRIYNKYDQSPVIVSFSTRESPIFTIPFPAVTICPLSKSDATKSNYTLAVKKLKHLKNITSEEKRNAHYLSLLCEQGKRYFPGNKTFTDEFLDKLDQLKPSFDNYFPCYFMGKTLDCNKIMKPIILDEGICYTFNMLDRDEIFKDNVKHYSNYHKNENSSTWNIDEGYSYTSKLDTFPRRALLSGVDNAFEIQLFQLTSDLDYLCVEDVQGFYVALHAPHSIPSPKRQYFQVPLDSSVIAAVQPKMMTTSEEVKNYDPFDRECYFTNERPLKYFKIYTPENCKLECVTNYTLEQCGCVAFYMPRENGTVLCATGNIECMENAETELKEMELKNLIDIEYNDEGEAHCDCMPLCTQLSYDIEQSVSDWDWGKQLKALEVIAYREIKEKFKVAKLSVFFKQEQFLTSQRNELYGPIDFLANVGGILGLFIGFSFLSLVEIIYFFTIRIFCNMRQDRVWNGE